MLDSRMKEKLCF